MSDTGRGRRYSFGFADSVPAEAGGVEPDALHRDVDAICRCADAVVPLAERLGVPAPVPHLAGFTYPHVSTPGVEITFPEGAEPWAAPVIRAEEEKIAAFLEVAGQLAPQIVSP